MGARVDDPNPDLWIWAKALAASAAGRALLLLNATRSDTPSLQKVIGIALYELPLVCAFALLGWHVAGLIGAATEEWRVTITIILAWAGQRGLDMVLQRVFPPRG
jgi:hypothetical protein